MDLSDLGWCSEFAQHLSSTFPPLMPARVAVTHRNRYLLYTEDGVREAVLAGSALRGDEPRLPVTGDWVLIQPGEDLSRLVRVLPRRTVFRRKPPISGGKKLITFEGEERFGGGATVDQVIAANMDLILVVTGLDGDYSLNRIRRYLILARCSGAEVAVVLNKSDLGDPARALAELGDTAPVLSVSARTGQGLAGLEALFRPGRTLALIGSSGVGKSSIINALLGEDRQYVSSKSHSTGKGQHTTTRRELVPLPGGGFLLDTPGMREVQLWAEEEDVVREFEPLEALALQCRFSDCHHGSEPGCAVKRSVECGLLEGWVLDEYRRLAREVRYLALRRQERLRVLQRKRTGSLGHR